MVIVSSALSVRPGGGSGARCRIRRSSTVPAARSPGARRRRRPVDRCRVALLPSFPCEYRPALVRAIRTPPPAPPRQIKGRYVAGNGGRRRDPVAVAGRGGVEPPGPHWVVKVCDGHQKSRPVGGSSRWLTDIRCHRWCPFRRGVAMLRVASTRAPKRRAGRARDGENQIADLPGVIILSLLSQSCTPRQQQPRQQQPRSP